VLSIRWGGCSPQIGSFEVGKCFDALVVDIEDTQEHREETDEQHQHYIPQKQQHQQHKHLHNIDPFDIGRPATDMEEFERFVHLGDSRNIKQVVLVSDTLQHIIMRRRDDI